MSSFEDSSSRVRNNADDIGKRSQINTFKITGACNWNMSSHGGSAGRDGTVRMEQTCRHGHRLLPMSQTPGRCPGLSSVAPPVLPS